MAETPKIHIPPEVIEAMTAARRKYIATIETDTRIGELTDGEHADISADEITAALAAWVKCGMARGEAYISDDGTHWAADTAYNETNVEPEDYLTKAIIIRTEAST